VVHGSGGNKPKSLGGTVANQIWWLCQPLDWFTAPAKSLRKKFVWIVINLVSDYEICCPAKLMCQGRMGNHEIGFRCLPIIESPGGLIIAPEELCRLGEGPSQILIAILTIASALFLAIARPAGRYLTAIGGKVAYLGETADVAGLQHYGPRENQANAGYRLQTGERLEYLYFIFHGHFNRPDLFRKEVNAILAYSPAHGQIFLGCQQWGDMVYSHLFDLLTRQL
jgi:hypothetical protein